MRFKYKWVVAIGLVLGIASVWWERSGSRGDLGGDEELLDSDLVKARARESVAAPERGATATVTTAATGPSVIHQTLTSGAAPAEQAKTLLTRFPTLPPAAQFEAAHHISNLLPNDAYGDWAGYLTNSAVPPEVRGVIYADLVRRPNSLRLPLLLQLARSSTPQSPDAAQLLRATLREDHGTDWNAWSRSISTWLQTHPDPAYPGFPGTTVGN